MKTEQTRILIDYGTDLDDITRLPDIEGLNIGKPIYDAIFCTHYHQDHIGRINEVLPEIPVYMSGVCRKITETVFIFSKSKGKFTKETINIQDRTPIIIKDIKVTPYIVDHSAYGAFMFLIEAEEKKILHTGDFRSNGYKGVLLEKTLREIGKIDVLLTEGTSLSRPQMKSISEAELAKDIAEKTKQYDQVLVLTSTTNIDRVTTIQKVANRTGKVFIHDLLLELVLQCVTQKIPNALNSNKIGVYMPSYLYTQRNKPEYQDLIKPYEEQIKRTGKMLHGRFIMNCRVSMAKDIEKLKMKNGVLENCCLVYSMWNGYKTQDEQTIKFLNKMKKLNIPVIDGHTSGHADYTAMQILLDITKADRVIPMHTENKEGIKQYTDKAVILEDMQTYEI